MWPDQLSNPGPLALESDALSSALHGPAERSWWLSSTKCFIPSSKAVGLLMQVKRFLKVFTIYKWLCVQRFVPRTGPCSNISFIHHFSYYI